ncbi:ComF family protein [Candidatus Kuenenbacteria bacterium]|nr:ComF family protein [Candidatus Kuenenbacteria bacterium]
MLLRKYWENLLDYIFPKECADCGKEGEYLCSSCFNKIGFIEKFPCFVCNNGDHEIGICPECSSKTGIDQIIVATTYTDNLVGQMVEDFKYNYIESLKHTLAKILNQQIQNRELAGVFWNNVLLPIPLHKKRLIERGFNQAEELAKVLSLKYNCILEDGLILRVKNTDQQAKLNRQERFENLKQAFQFNLKKPVPGKVILIDDVLTTGVTFAEAAQTLKQAGVQKVVCVAVCHG